MALFSARPGPRGDRTFIDVRSFAAAALTENGPVSEQDALTELASIGYRIAELPDDIFLTSGVGSAVQDQGASRAPAGIRRIARLSGE